MNSNRGEKSEFQSHNSAELDTTQVTLGMHSTEGQMPQAVVTVFKLE